MIKTLYKTFQHWSDGGGVKIISDPHFDDADMKTYFNYPHPQIICNKINKGLKKGDTLVILGDIGDEKWVEKLHCRHKVLIMGNHDRGTSIYEPYFDEIYQGPLMIAEKILLSHEPIETDWCLNIHGHTHGHDTEDEYHINVCCDITEFEPLNLKTVIELGLLKQITSLHRRAIDKQKE